MEKALEDIEELIRMYDFERDQPFVTCSIRKKCFSSKVLSSSDVSTKELVLSILISGHKSTQQLKIQR